MAGSLKPKPIESSRKLESPCHAIKVFDLSIGEPGCFDHGATKTLFLSLLNHEPVKEVMRIIGEAAGKKNDGTPHLTIGRWLDSNALQQIDWKTEFTCHGQFDCTEVRILKRETPDSSYELIEQIAFVRV